jgi:hypothetical protein
MIDYSLNSQQGSLIPSKPHKVLKMVQNDRMAGSVPAWVDAQGSEDDLAYRLAAIEPGGSGLTEALALQDPQNNAQPNESGAAFGFGDLVDMINPLQHIPVIGSLYRELTGDQIRPIGRIVGGGIFGGPLGAAGGLANVIVEEETGTDIAGNAMNVVMNREPPSWRPQEKTPQQVLTAALNQSNNPADLPGTVLAFADLRTPQEATRSIKKDSIETMTNFRVL